MMAKKTAKNVVLITGASSGFGREFARIFAREGNDLLLISNAAKDLKTVAKETKAAGVEAHYLNVDLTRLDAGTRIMDYVRKHNLRVSVLVNNAGVGNYGKFADVPMKKQLGLVDLNMRILTELCHLIIPHMIKNGGGRILNVASMASFQPGPYYATYYASKGYVLLLTEAMREEYRDQLVICALCPGPSPTGFFREAPMRATSWVLRASMLPPKVVAEIGYRGLMRGKDIIIPGLIFHIIPWGSRLFPRKLMTRISRIMVEIAARG